MIKIETKLTGDLDQALRRYEAKVSGGVIFSGAAAMARVIYEEVRLNASPERLNKAGGRRPKGRQPGTLRDAIYRAYSPEESSDGVRVYKVSVNKAKAGHWHWVEFGNSKQAATPYIRPALDRMSDAARAGMERMRERLSED